KEGSSADDARRSQCRTARLEQRLDRLELDGIDDWRHRHFDHLGLRLALAALPIFGVEAVPDDIRGSRHYLVHGIDAPASAVTGSYAGFVQILGNRFDAH